MRCAVLPGFGRVSVKKIGSRMKSFSIERRRHGGMKKECTKNIVNCTNGSFDFTVLWRSIRKG